MKYEAGIERQEGKGKGGLVMVKKNLAHGIRYLVLGLMLAKKGTIDDFTASNHYHRQLMNEKEPSPVGGTLSGWNHWEQNYRPIYQELEMQLREFVHGAISAAVAHQLELEQQYSLSQQKEVAWALTAYLRGTLKQLIETGIHPNQALKSTLDNLSLFFAIKISENKPLSRLVYVF